MKPFDSSKFKRRKMNKTEARFADLLELSKQDGLILDYCFEGVKLKIGEGRISSYYTIDFFVTYRDYFECIEIKGGHITAKGKLTFKAAMKQYPHFSWRMIQYTAKGGFQDIENNKGE